MRLLSLWLFPPQGPLLGHLWDLHVKRLFMLQKMVYTRIAELLRVCRLFSKQTCHFSGHICPLLNEKIMKKCKLDSKKAASIVFIDTKGWTYFEVTCAKKHSFFMLKSASNCMWVSSDPSLEKGKTTFSCNSFGANSVWRPYNSRIRLYAAFVSLMGICLPESLSWLILRPHL